jgi:hypothetical protein
MVPPQQIKGKGFEIKACLEPHLLSTTVAMMAYGENDVHKYKLLREKIIVWQIKHYTHIYIV